MFVVLVVLVDSIIQVFVFLVCAPVLFVNWQAYDVFVLLAVFVEAMKQVFVLFVCAPVLLVNVQA